MKPTAVAVLLACGTLVPVASAQVSITLIGQDLLGFNPDTGLPDPAGTGFIATDLTPDGARVVGTTGISSWVWDAGTGELPTVIGNDSGTPGISHDGLLVSGGRKYADGTFPDSDFAIPPVLFTGELRVPATYSVASGLWTPLPFIQIDDGLGGWQTNAIELDDSVGSVLGMSGDGSTMVGFGWIDVGGVSGAFVSDGVLTLPLDSGGQTHSRATAASYDGRVIGGTVGSGRRPVLWADGELLELSGNSGNLNAVSENGLHATGNILRSAYLWSSDGAGGYEARSLFSVSAATGVYTRPNTVGLAVTDDGLLVGGGETTLGGSAAGVVWTPATGLVYADDYFDLIGIVRPMVTRTDGFLSPLQIQSITAVSGDGRYVVGVGVAEGDPANLLRRSFIAEIVRPCGFGDFALPFQSLDATDNLEMIAALEAGEKRADMNADGVVNVFDMIAHLRAYDAGCD